MPRKDDDLNKPGSTEESFVDRLQPAAKRPTITRQPPPRRFVTSWFDPKIKRRQVLAQKEDPPNGNRKFVQSVERGIVASPRAAWASLARNQTIAPSQQNDGHYRCSTIWHDAATDFGWFALPETGRLWPGGIFTGPGILGGSFEEVKVRRKPMVLATEGHSSYHVYEEVAAPAFHTAQQAVAEIRKGFAGEFPSNNSSYQFFQVLSRDHLRVGASGSASFLGLVGGSGGVEWESASFSRRFFLHIMEEAYVVTATPIDPTVKGAAAWFVTSEEAPGDAAALRPQSADRNWVIVDQVRYGRALSVIVETEGESEQFSAQAEAHFRVFMIASADGSVNTGSSQARTRVWIHTDGGNVIALNSVEEANQEIRRFFGEKGTLVPIAYGLSTLDGERLGIRSAGTFPSRICTPKPLGVRVTFQQVECIEEDDGGSDPDEELQLRVRVRVRDGKGRDIVDSKGLNREVADHFTHGKKQLGALEPWTWRTGTPEYPIRMSDSPRGSAKQTRKFGEQYQTFFPLDPDEENATVGIRVSALEFDDDSDHDLLYAEPQGCHVRELGQGRTFTLTATHDETELLFTIRVEPVFAN